MVAKVQEERRPWSRLEVEATVSDYFHMLKQHLAGQAYSKTAHRRELAKRLDQRSEHAIENKHRNISAVLQKSNHFWIPGYAPLTHYQRLLEEVVLEVAFNDKTLDDAALRAAEAIAIKPLVVDFDSAEVDPPRFAPRSSEQDREYRSRRIGIKRDYIQREAVNRSLGIAGEEFVVEFERQRLTRAGKASLAGKVEHSSQVLGDGLGFDVKSYDATGKERLIEVKTTSFAKETPFYLSRSEFELSREVPEQFHLYRVFEFRDRPRLFTLAGPVDQFCHLDATTFLARFS